MTFLLGRRKKRLCLTLLHDNWSIVESCNLLWLQTSKSNGIQLISELNLWSSKFSKNVCWWHRISSSSWNTYNALIHKLRTNKNSASIFQSCNNLEFKVDFNAVAYVPAYDVGYVQVRYSNKSTFFHGNKWNFSISRSNDYTPAYSTNNS